MGNIPSSALRQPPPPPAYRHCHNEGSLMVGVMETHSNGEEQNSEMAGGNCVNTNQRTRTFYFRRCKKHRRLLTNIESLPDEMVFNILVQLPAQDIYKTRLVCRKWYHMVHTHNFIYAHLQHAPRGILIQSRSGIGIPIFVAMRQGRIEISNFSYKFRDIVSSSCNGLVVERVCKNPCTFYIANPATKQHFTLPPFYRQIQYYFRCSLAYAAASMEYKVVYTYDCKYGNANKRCAILTVGVDTFWRHVQIDHLSIISRELFSGTALVTEGFLHWFSDGRNYFLSLNLETETIRQIPLPQDYERFMYFLSTGSYLSFLTACSKFLWEVWEMKPKTGEWTKLPNIDMEAQKCTLEQLSCDCSLRPIGWVKYKEVLVFRISFPSSLCIAYNVCTQEIESFELKYYAAHQNYVAHTNSLVWLDGC